MLLKHLLGASTLLLTYVAAAGVSNNFYVPGPSKSTQSKVSAAWWANWHGDEYPFSAVSWSKYTHLFYSFILTKPDLTGLSDIGLENLQAFSDECHKNGVKAIGSIGGWTGSGGFSFNIGTAENRTNFVKSVTKLIDQYNLDGIDFDWEYPGHQGIGCNAVNPDDTSNFLSFLQELQVVLKNKNKHKTYTLSAAVGVLPFAGPDENPIADSKPFTEVLNWIGIMNYDLFGPWSKTVGPNGAVDDSCAPEAARVGSARSAVDAWKAAGFPANQIVLGVPAYGHSYRVYKKDAYVEGSTEIALYPPFDAPKTPVGDKWDDPPTDPPSKDVCGVDRVQASGIVNYFGLIDLGYLDTDGKPKDGRPFRFDDCSKAAFSYNPEEETMVAYDNPDSMFAKGKFIKDEGLKGFATWEAAGDYKDYLLNAIREGAGFDNHKSCPNFYRSFSGRKHQSYTHQGGRKPYGRKKINGLL